MRGRIVNGLTNAPGLPVTATSGELDLPTDGPAELRLIEGGADLLVPLADDPMLRCYHLGLLAGLPSRAGVTISVERAGGSSAPPVVLELPAGSSVAAIVEVEPTPQDATHMRLHLESSADTVTLYDLFVIATG